MKANCGQRVLNNINLCTREYILLEFRISFNRELYDKGIISFQIFSDMNKLLFELENKELLKQSLMNSQKVGKD